MSSVRKSNEEVIFNTARKIDSLEARQEYLGQVCAGDAALRERVEHLLQSQADESQFLEAPVLAPTQASSPIREQAGSQIGRYKLLQRIGEGGFGVVYMAEQEKPIRRKVALKIIKPGMDTKEVVARFEAERQALALMDHPNIAKVLDGGSTESGRPYFVMELVKGVPLTSFCDENKLDTSKRLELFQTICKAIQHAHQKGVIHRDIKPSNVMVTLHDGEPVVKVIDFGVSKAISQQLTEKTMFTAYGQMIGTPQYMSPEQAEMSGLDIDTRSDIYSLGVLLYELLTGSTPIQPERLRETGYAEMQRMIREEEPPRPSARLSTLGEQSAKIAISRGSDPQKLGTLLRGDLDWIAMKALEKNRDRRYETANGLATDVQRYLDGEAVTACPPSFAYRFRKFARKNRAVLYTTGSVVTVLILATVFSTLSAMRANRADQRSRKSLVKLLAEQQRAEKANDDLREAWGNDALQNAIDQFLRGNFEQAKASLEIAETHDANPGEIALCQAAIAYYGNNRTDLKKHASIAFELLPDSIAAEVLLARSKIMEGTTSLGETLAELESQITTLKPSLPMDLLCAAQSLVYRDVDRSIQYLSELQKTHNSRSVYYELARAHQTKAQHSYDLADIETSLRYASIAFHTMPGNELAFRRYVNAHLMLAHYYRAHGEPRLESYHFGEAENVVAEFVADQPDSAFGHQSKVVVHLYHEQWEEAAKEALITNRLMKQYDSYANSVALVVRQGGDPTPAFEKIKEVAPLNDAWEPWILLHSHGYQAALEATKEWEFNTPPKIHPDYAWVVHETLCLLGHPERVAPIAQRHLARQSGAFGFPFSANINQYVCGTLSEDALLARAESRVDRMMAHFTVGCRRLGEGKRKEAMHHFEEVEREDDRLWSGISGVIGCPRAAAYLQQMRTDPEWPSWIPVNDSE